MASTTRIFSRAVLLLLLFGLAAWLSSRPFYPSPSAIERGPVLLGDSQGELSAAEAVHRARPMLRQGETGAIDLKTRDYWWVAELGSPLDYPNWVLHMGNTAVEQAELYLFDGNELQHHDRVDLLAKAQAGPPDYLIGHHFPLTLAPGETRTVALHLTTEVAHSGLIFIKPEPVARAEASFHMLAIWSGAGAIIALIGYNLFLGIGLRMPTYLFYAGHAGGHLLYLLTALGMIGASLPILDRYLLLNIPSIGLGVLFGALFIYTFLELPRLSPRLAGLFRLFIGALLLSPLLALLLEPHQFLTLIRSSHLLLSVLVIAAALVGIAADKPEARYILIGWGGLIAITAPGMLGVLDIIELHIDAGVWALWAIVFEMFFLSLALADRVRRLSGEREAAKAANAAKSAFLANMSHEIRTPLNGVLGMVEVLRETPLNDQQREYLGHIGQSGAALLEILDDILDYSRVEAGRIQLEEADFEPHHLLEQLHFLLANQADKKGLQLLLSIDPQIPQQLSGDAGRLRQVLLNLLGNALKFTEQGSVHLKGQSLGEDEAGHRLRLSVSDTGIGIDETMQRHLFDRFSQADSTIARRFGGSGLGLAIVHELVALMGGEIRVHSQPGRGSRFEVELTLRPGSGQPKEAPVAPPSTLPPQHILVVDDDRINRLVASKLLAADGHRVDAVESGAAALQRVGDEDFDVVLMDLGMPEMDGIETTRRLRERGVAIPIIGLTAHVLPEQHAACLEAGMNDVIHKPVRPDRLRQIIAQALGGADEPAAAVAAS